MNRRVIYFGLTTTCFIALILIVELFNNNQLVRGFIGDIIIILQVYFLAKVFYDFHALKLASFTLVVAFTIEFLQYLDFTTYIGVEHNAVARLVFGAVFDPYDLIAYTIGAVLVYIIDTRLIRNITKAP